MNRKTVLITGLASSLARSIAIQLNELGMQIFGTTSKQDYRCSLTEQIFTIDFRDQLDSLDKLNRYRFDVVIHVASLTPQRGQKDFMQVNCSGPLKFFSLAPFQNLECFINISSCSVYGPQTGNSINEFTPTNPSSEYGLSKLVFEQSIEELLKKTQTYPSIVHLRVPTLIGENVSPGLFHRWLEVARHGGQIQVSNPNLRVTGVIDEISLARRLSLILTNIPKLPVVRTEVAHSNGDITFLEAADLFASTFNCPSPNTFGITERQEIFYNIDSDWWSNISTFKILNAFVNTSKL